MKTLPECISQQVQINSNSLDVIASRFEERSLRKGAYFLEAGTICREMAFIESGYLRMFDLAEGKDITLWIGSEGAFISSLSSFTFQTPNHWRIQAVTDCRLQVIGRTEHFDLCKLLPSYLEFDNKLLARSFAILEQRMFSHLHTTAQQRFEGLMESNPLIFNQVPLQHIASMLGITPETLSRLRKNAAGPIS